MVTILEFVNCTSKWVNFMICKCCLNKAVNNDFECTLLGTSGGTSMNISQAPLCRGDENTKIREPSFIEPEIQGCTFLSF